MVIHNHITRQARVMLALWRKAAGTEEGFVIKLPSKALAISTRQELYRAILPYRGRPDLDPVLCEVADKFTVSIVEDDVIAFRPRKVLAAIEALFGDLGLDENDLLTFEEQEVQASAERLIAAGTARSTPFFTREG